MGFQFRGGFLLAEFFSILFESTRMAWYYNEVSAGGLNLWGRLSSLPFGQFGMAGWKACPTRLGPPIDQVETLSDGIN